LLPSLQDQWHKSPQVQRMVANLAAERQAVLAFWHRLVDDTLSPRQEARLEAAAYPWCADLWQMCGELAAGQADRGKAAARPGQVRGLRPL
jgi:hypothetical protein